MERPIAPAVEPRAQEASPGDANELVVERPTPDPELRGGRRAVLGVILVFVSVVLTLAGVSLALNYRAALQEKRQDLRNLVQTQVGMIKAVARFDRENSPDYAGGPFAATLSQIGEAHALFSATGEFTIAQLREDQIIFLLRHQLIDQSIPDPVPLSSSLAEPMRRALAGESGTLIGLDYRGVRVVAAFEPVPELGIGVVAKTDLAEVRAPFIRTALQTVAASLFMVLIGTILIRRIGSRWVATLQTARARAETYLERAGSMFVILDAEGRVRKVNSRTCAVLGYPREAVVGANWFEGFLPHDQASLAKELHRSLVSGEGDWSEHFENEVITKDGRKRLILWHNTRIEDETTGELLSLSSGEDITEARTAQEAVARAEEKAILLGRIMEDWVAEVYVFDAGTLCFDSVSRGARENLGYSAAELRRMTPLDIKPSHTAESFSQLMQPLRDGTDESVRFETYHRRKDGSEYPAEVLLELHGERDTPVFVAQIQDLTRQRAAEEDAAERESRFRAAAESLTDALIITDQEGVIQDWNSAAETMFGWTSEDAVGRSVQMLIPPEFREKHEEGFGAAVRDGHLSATQEPLQALALRGDGTEFPVKITMSTWSSGGEQRFVALVQDVTDAVAALERTRQAERARTVAAGLSDVLLAAQTELDFVEGVAQLIVETGGYRVCWIGSKEEDEAKTVRPLASAGAETEYIDSLRITWGSDESGQGPTGTAIRTGVTSINQNFSSDSALAPWRESAYAHGLAASVAVPLVVDGKIVGALNVYAGEPDAFQDEEVRTLEAIAANVGLGLAGLRASEQREIAEAELERERHSLAERVVERTAELSAAYAKLENASRAKDDFLASMSHELRTPLNTIITVSESLEEGVYGELSPDQVHSMGTVMSSSTHLLSLINDLLDLSKIGAGKLEVELESVRVSDLCEASLRMVKEMAHKKDISVSASFEPGVECVQADGRRLKQVLVNLLSNAVKFTDAGGEIGLDVTVDSEVHQVTFSVWDTGIGLSEDQMGRLFQPFTQLDSGLDREFEGTGLGLSIVARLTELQGGSVTVESEGPGEGSRFSVVLPSQEQMDSEGDMSSMAVDGGRSEAPASGGPHILIVDDNEKALSTLARYFEFLSFRVSLAHNGLEAVEQAVQVRPDLILMDVQMPMMDGLEATRRIRATDGLGPHSDHCPHRSSHAWRSREVHRRRHG